jgi:hypothetical protein
MLDRELIAPKHGSRVQSPMSGNQKGRPDDEANCIYISTENHKILYKSLIFQFVS